MKYFVLSDSSESEDIGPEYPQAGMKPGYNFDAPDSLWNVPHNEFNDVKPNLTYFDMAPGSKLTDFISTPVSHGFVVSSLVKHLLGDFKLTHHRFYPAIVKHDGNFYNYFWLQLVSDLVEHIDLEKSSFCITKFNKNLGSIKIKSREELMFNARELIGEHKFIQAVRIHLKPTFIQLRFDLFHLPILSFNTFISDNLKNRLLERGVTGIEIRESEIVDQ